MIGSHYQFLSAVPGLDSLHAHLSCMVALYRDYFEAVAVNHPALRHDDEHGEQCFETVDIAEAFGQVRDGIRPQAFLLRLFHPYRSYEKQESGSYQITQGGFLLARFGDVRQSGGNVMTQALDDSLKICDQIVARMVGDSRAGHPLFDYCADKADALNFQAMPAKNVADGTYHGYICTFELSKPFDSFGECANPAWLDGGLTDF